MSSREVELRVEENPQQRRYEVYVGDRLGGFTAYRKRGDALVFTHTEIEPDLEGGGVGSRLVRGALDDVRAQGLKLVPLCPFVAAYVRRHPEYANLLAEVGS
jgi:predicted GNAT family acetyltransferase